MLMNYHDTLLVPNCSDLERQLRPFVFLPNHHRRNYPGSHLPYFPSVVWKGEIKLPDECGQECVHLYGAIEVFSFCSL